MIERVGGNGWERQEKRTYGEGKRVREKEVGRRLVAENVVEEQIK